jgi:hypothetical protein
MNRGRKPNLDGNGKPIVRQQIWYEKHREELLKKKREKYGLTHVKVRKHPWKGDEPKNKPILRDPIEMMLDKMSRDRGEN